MPNGNFVGKGGNDLIQPVVGILINDDELEVLETLICQGREQRPQLIPAPECSGYERKSHVKRTIAPSEADTGDVAVRITTVNLS